MQPRPLPNQARGGFDLVVPPNHTADRHPAVSDPPAETHAPAASEPAGVMVRGADVTASEPRNFVVLAVYQIVMRIGWIFKTESVIMPAVLDTIGGPGWLRGCLPLLNRFGCSVPPILFARRLTLMRRKKRGLAACTLAMSMVFLALASMWLITGTSNYGWMPVCFLVLYTLFFIATGMNQLAFSTVQGKLIQPARRGRLLLASNVVGAACAIAVAWYLLGHWLRSSGGDIQYIFGFAGFCFGVSAPTALLLVEPADNYRQPTVAIAQHFTAAAEILIRDVNFRRLAIVAALFGTSLMLFPHYQALGRERLGLQLDNLMWWVIVQNTGTALFSLAAGPVADWRGNRLVLRVILFGVSSVPVVAIVLAHAGSLGAALYCLVFVMIGLTPLTFRTLNNYTLEICEPADHPRYLSALSLCLATPIFLSPLVGLAVDATSYELVFFGVAGILLLGWLLTFTLNEPRHHISGQAATAGVGVEA